MRHRRIGHATVSAVGLGCLALSSNYRAISDRAAAALVGRALELGINHFDTADIYGAGHNERLLGKALRGHRDAVVVATKFGQRIHPDGSRTADGRPEYVVESCEGSLARLGLETIDLYYLHRVDPAVPVEETVGAMARLVEEGKVLGIGISEVTPATLRRAHATHPVAALQAEYSLWARFAESNLLPTCRELGISYVAYAPLGRGFLTGTITSLNGLGAGDRRREHPRFQSEILERNLGLLEPLRHIAAAHSCTPAQVALAWSLGRYDRLIPIPATTSPAHLAENAAAVEIDLTPDEIATLSEVFAPGAVAGDRFPPDAIPIEGG